MKGALELYTIIKSRHLKVVSATFLVCFLRLKESACETRKNVYFTLKALFVLEIINFKFSDIEMS